MVNAMNNINEIKKQIISMCDMALKGELSIGDFYEKWPKEANSYPLFKQIYDDVEDAVEHLPSSIITNKKLLSKWMNSKTYLTVFLDFIVLSCDISYEMAYQYRKYILTLDKLTKDSIINEVEELRVNGSL